MKNIKSLQTRTAEDKFANASLSHLRWLGILLVAGGLLLIISAPAIIWLFRGELADLSPRVLKTLWYGAGGLALLYFSAGLPLGAILLAAGGAYMFPASGRARRILLPILGIQLVYFTYHAIATFRYTSVPFLLFALIGCVFLVLFLALVWSWAHRRQSLEPERQRVADLQLGGGLCFFTAAWQTCGLAGAPGFAAYPELAQKLGNQSFLVGQLLAVQVFTALGFFFLLLAMRTEQTRNPAVDEQIDKVNIGLLIAYHGMVLHQLPNIDSGGQRFCRCGYQSVPLCPSPPNRL